MLTTGRSTLTTAATLRATLWSRTSGRYVKQRIYAVFTAITRLIIATTGHSQLGRRAEVSPLAVRHWYFTYPRQRFQRSPRFRRTPSLHDREVRRRGATPQVAYVLQPSGSASLQVPRPTHTETHVGCRGDGRLRTGVEGETTARVAENVGILEDHFYRRYRACVYVRDAGLNARTIDSRRIGWKKHGTLYLTFP